MSSNPDTKTYLNKDVFTYISFAVSEEKNVDTTHFKIKEMAEGDTAFYSNGIMILNKVVKNPDNEKYHFKPGDAALMADITFISKDSLHYKAMPLIQIDSTGIIQVDDTVYAQNMYVQFAGVSDTKKIKIGIKESDKLIDFVTLKAYIFPWVNLVWAGLIIMAIGIVMSAVKRAKLSALYTALALLFTGIALFYLFLLAN
jgi:cytochrome c-type biogenesis protein CcmF